MNVRACVCSCVLHVCVHTCACLCVVCVHECVFVCEKGERERLSVSLSDKTKIECEVKVIKRQQKNFKNQLNFLGKFGKKQSFKFKCQTIGTNQE